MPTNDGGLGTALVGEKIVVNSRSVAVTKMLGEGGFSYVYLVKELSDTAAGQTLHNSAHGDSQTGGKDMKGDMKKRAGSASAAREPDRSLMVLKVTSIHSRNQRDIAEKEAKLLQRLSHPSIIKMFDTCYRQEGKSGGGFLSKESNTMKPQHCILMEYCEGGHALDVCNKLAAAGKRFDLSTLIIAFGQICNAVSYLHAQRPPIVHRDLKPVNFLVKNGAYKLCDFGSAVFGHVDLRTQKARAEAEEVIEKTTTQMFRAPEMVDLYSAKRLTQATDVWALGCCLYSLAFLQNCFEEGSNLAILSRKYKIPDDNPYGEGLVELLDRMLTVDAKQRSDMTEVILCLSAVYSGRHLPPRRKLSKPKEKEKEGEEGRKTGKSERSPSASSGGDRERRDSRKKKEKEKPPAERVGAFRTDGQGISGDGLGPSDKKEAKKLNPNSAAARRRMAAGAAAPVTASGTTASAPDLDFSSFNEAFEQNDVPANPDLAFSTAGNPFASVTIEGGENGTVDVVDGNDIFGAFDNSNNTSSPNAFASFDNAWGQVAPESGNGEKSAQTATGNHDEPDANAENKEGKSGLRRTKSGKDAEKHRARRQRKTLSAEASVEGVEVTFEEMNVSDPGDKDAADRKPRREGEKRPPGKGSGNERRRRPKEGEAEERSPPRRNRSHRESRTTSSS